MEACRAHNPEVPGSKPGVAILAFCRLHYVLTSKSSASCSVNVGASIAYPRTRGRVNVKRLCKYCRWTRLHIIPSLRHPSAIAWTLTRNCTRLPSSLQAAQELFNTMSRSFKYHSLELSQLRTCCDLPQVLYSQRIHIVCGECLVPSLPRWLTVSLGKHLWHRRCVNKV